MPTFSSDLYDEEIYAVDQAIGVLIEGIKNRGTWDQTWMIITSDHGEEFWDHGGFEHGHSLLSELTRVPLVVRGPEVRYPGSTIATVVEHVDLFESMLSLADIPRTNGLGEDLLPLLQGKDMSSKGRAFSENILYGNPQFSLVMSDYRLVIDQKTRIGTVWAMNLDGTEKEKIPEEQQQIEANKLLQEVQNLRGHLQIVDSLSNIGIPSQEAFQQLKALGYIE